jgi:hypothetical protein
MEILEKECRHDIHYAPPGSFFVTSDNPVVTIAPDGAGRANVGMGFGWPRTEVLLPLNKRACLILSRRGRGEKVQATDLGLRQINDLVMCTAQKYACAAEVISAL